MSTTLSQISAVYIQHTQYEKKLNVLLVPPDEIRGDVRDLAGSLGFNMEDVNYIMEKKYPFLYMIDQWIKRVGAESATLQCLQSKLEEMRRLDAVDEIKNAIADLKDKSSDDLDKIANTHNSMLRRCESSMSLCPSAKQYYLAEDSIPRGDRVDLGSNVSIDKLSKKSKFSARKLFGSRSSLNKEPSVEKHSRTTKNSSKLSFPAKPGKEKATNEAPTVYVVYTTEDIDHLKAIRDMVEKLRTEYGVDVRSEMFESSNFEDDKAFYLYSNLITSEYVIYICTDASAADEDKKKEKFIKKFILDFMYEDSSYKSKYIPVLLPGCDRRDIPHFLNGPTAYSLENSDFYDDVYRRVFRIEKYALGALPSKRPQLKPIEISQMF